MRKRFDSADVPGIPFPVALPVVPACILRNSMLVGILTKLRSIFIFRGAFEGYSPNHLSLRGGRCKLYALCDSNANRLLWRLDEELFLARAWRILSGI